MRPRLAWGLLFAGLALLGAWSLQTQLGGRVEVFDPPVRPIEAAPLCPWRAPEVDQARYFPDATSHVAETRVLSAHRVELKARLGRQPEPEENALLRYQMLAGSDRVGFVLTRRAKGEHGAIEVVLALDAESRVKGVGLQRLREPDAHARALADPAWLDRFRGRTHDRGWETDDVASLPEEARASGRAIREAVRSLLVLQAAAEGGLH